MRTKNRIERVLYANLCQASNLQYPDSIIIDKTTRQASQNSPLHMSCKFSFKIGHMSCNEVLNFERTKTKKMDRDLTNEMFLKQTLRV